MGDVPSQVLLSVVSLAVLEPDASVATGVITCGTTEPGCVTTCITQVPAEPSLITICLIGGITQLGVTAGSITFGTIEPGWCVATRVTDGIAKPDVVSICKARGIWELLFVTWVLAVVSSSRVPSQVVLLTSPSRV